MQTNTTEIKIDLNNREEAQKELILIQETIDELLDVINLQEKEMLNQKVVIESAKEQIKNLTNTAVGLSDSLKAIHIILNTKQDIFKGDKEMKEIMNTLSTFVLGSGSIKLGVLSNE